MAENINFHNLWKSQASTQPPPLELFLGLKKYQRTHVRKLFFSTFVLMATSLFIIWIWIGYNPEMATTKLGIILIILAMAIFGYSYNRQYPILKKLDDTLSNSDYLETLLLLERQQQHLQSFMLGIYFLMLSLGMCLYMIEPTLGMPVWGKIAAYALTFGWIAFAWFYLKPKTIKKQQAKLNELIAKFESIQNQIEGFERL